MLVFMIHEPSSSQVGVGRGKLQLNFDKITSRENEKNPFGRTGIANLQKSVCVVDQICTALFCLPCLTCPSPSVFSDVKAIHFQ